MSSYRFTMPWAVMMLTLVSFVFDVLGADYRSDKNYHLTYPDAWHIATKEDQNAVNNAARELIQNTNFKRIDVLFYGPQSDSIPNVNIIIAERIVINSNSADEVKDGLRVQLTSAGLTPTNMESIRTKVAGKDAIVSTWNMKMPAPDYPLLKQRQYVIAGKTQTYIITCTAPASGFDVAMPAFTQMIDTFQIDNEPATSPVDWWVNLPKWAQYGIIGGIFGGIVGLFRSWNKKK